MHSPVGWLCFGILVLCVLNVESSNKIGHGKNFPVQQTYVPTYEFVNYVPKVVARRLSKQNDDYDEDEPRPNNNYPDDEEEEDEEAAGGTDDEEDSAEEEEEEGTYAGPDTAREDSEEDEEDEMGRQAFTGQHPYGLRYFSRNVQAPNQVLFRKVSKKQVQGLLRSRSTKQKKSKKQKRTNALVSKPPGSTPKEETLQQQTSLPVQALIIQKELENSNQKQHAKQGTASTQFVVTPVADLILRLSVSLARPVGIGNSTAKYINVPIRLPEVKTNVVGYNTTEGKTRSKNCVELPKLTLALNETESMKNPTIDDAEDDEDKDPMSLNVTELANSN